MKNRFYAVLTATILLAATGCAQPAQEDMEYSQSGDQAPHTVEQRDEAPGTAFQTLEELLAYTNARHRAIKRPEVNLTAYVADFDDGIYDAAYAQQREYDPDAPLTQEQAQEDVEALQTTMKRLYPPYYYFGGDEVFDKAFGAVLAAMEEAQEDSATAYQLRWALADTLHPIVQDAHFQIDRGALSPPSIPLRVGEEDYLKGEDGVYRVVGSDRAVTAVEGQDSLERLFKPFITEEGAIVYRPILTEYHQYNAPEELTVTYADGQHRLPVTALPWHQDTREQVELRHRGEIPVLSVHRMGYINEDNHDHDQFMEHLDTIKQAPVSIVDLRGNGGGNMVLSMKWLAGYAGQRVPTHSAAITTLKDMAMDPGSDTYVPLEEAEQYTPILPVTEKYSTFDRGEGGPVPNDDRLLVVLTGKSTASAAELFVDAAHSLDNTLFVGTNTSGTLLSNAYTSIWLPNSGLEIRMGSDLYLYPEGYMADFVGMEPDLWVDGDAEELVVRMLEKLA